MKSTYKEKVRALAANGLKRPKIEALLGHALTGDELLEYQRTSAVFDLQQRKRRQERKYSHLSDNERMAKKTAAANEVGELPPIADPERRERCRVSLVEFMAAYCTGAGGFLKSPPSPRMGEIIEHLQSVVRDGGRTHIRMARAHGKTSFIKSACIYALAYGFRRFVVAVSARHADASALIEDIFTLCEEGETFAADFPEIAVPIRKLGGVMQRARNQTLCGERTKIEKTAERIVLPSVPDSRSAGAILVARGFTGAARGLVRGSLRPDLVIFDDLQDEKVARNPASVQQYAETLEKTFLGLGGHDKQIAAFMTSTPIAPDDLSELFAGKSSWKTFTFPMILREPSRWGFPGDLWPRYFQIRQDAIAAGEPEHVRANEFYAEHRAEMDEGAEVLNPEFFDRSTEISGLQHAMNLRFSNGEDSFSAEYQMQPIRKHSVYALSAQLVASRVRPGTESFEKPEGTVFTAAATDLNPSYGFTTTIICFDRLQTAFVAAYKVFTDAPLPIHEDIPEQARVAQIYQALVAHGREIFSACRARGLTLDAWGIDAGGKQIEPVMRFANHSRKLCGLGCLPMLGRAGRSWNPNVRSRVAPERNGTILCADTAKGWKWLAFNADLWRETAQRAWLGEVGSPGGISIYDDAGKRHGDFAAQIVSERLEYKVSLQDGRIDYRWRQDGRKHDYGDAVSMCYALAGGYGISAGGFTRPIRRRPRLQVL